MKIIEAITTIKAAMEKSAAERTDSAWQEAMTSVGLKSQGNKAQIGIDEDYVGIFSGLEVRLNHTWRDTSKAFAPGPDRTRLLLELRQGGSVLDSYKTGHED